MNNLIIEEKDDCPAVSCDAGKGAITIEGKSIPDNPRDEIYEPVFEWIRNYVKNSPPEISVHIKLDYINTGSSNCLNDLFLILHDIHKKNAETNVIVNWYYEPDDEDMLEDGEEFSEKINLPFRMVVNEKEYS